MRRFGLEEVWTNARKEVVWFTDRYVSNNSVAEYSEESWERGF